MTDSESESRRTNPDDKTIAKNVLVGIVVVAIIAASLYAVTMVFVIVGEHLTTNGPMRLGILPDNRLGYAVNGLTFVCALLVSILGFLVTIAILDGLGEWARAEWGGQDE